jgi:hypothetical protein
MSLMMIELGLGHQSSPSIVARQAQVANALLGSSITDAVVRAPAPWEHWAPLHVNCRCLSNKLATAPAPTVFLKHARSEKLTFQSQIIMLQGKHCVSKLKS